MMLEEKPQRNTGLEGTSQGWDILMNKMRIQQVFSKGGLDLITQWLFIPFPLEMFPSKAVQN